MFYFDPALRQRMRCELGYDDDHRIFIYSGVLAHYQCIPRVLALFRELRAVDTRARLLLVSPDIECMRAMCGDIAPGDDFGCARLACSVAAKKLGVSGAHLQAGLLSFDCSICTRRR